MLAPDQDRRFTAVHAVLGALLGGTALYLVPTLALSGYPAAAIVTAIFWIGGLVALWVLLRRQAERVRAALRAERAAGELFRTLVDRGGEAYVILDAAGDVRFTTPNLARVVGGDPARLRENGGLLDMVRQPDRRRALQALSRVRREPGATTSLELRAWHADGSESFLEVRASNLVEQAAVGGILVTLRDITPRKTFETEIQHLAYYDALTGLANRRFFF